MHFIMECRTFCEQNSLSPSNGKPVSTVQNKNTNEMLVLYASKFVSPAPTQIFQNAICKTQAHLWKKWFPKGGEHAIFEMSWITFSSLCLRAAIRNELKNAHSYNAWPCTRGSTDTTTWVDTLCILSNTYSSATPASRKITSVGTICSMTGRPPTVFCFYLGGLSPLGTTPIREQKYKINKKHDWEIWPKHRIYMC